jgi:hypothetical protein
MSTEWVVTTVAEHLPLDEHRHGETTFTVTNPNPTPDRAVFEVVPGEGADPSWFLVEEPQRLVRGTASVSYRVQATIPLQAPPGSYALQGRVYSAESAPEETSVLSNRVMVEIKGAEKPKRQRKPWWILVAALVVVVLVVAGVVIWRSRSGTPPQSRTVAVPDISALTPEQGVAALEQLGLKVRLRYQFAAQTGPLAQSVPAGTQVARGSTVDVRAPSAVTEAVMNIPKGPFKTVPTLAWTQKEPFVHSWRLLVYVYVCFPPRSVPAACGPLLTIDEIVTKTSYTPALRLTPRQVGRAAPYQETVGWQVIPLDDFGNVSASRQSLFDVIP